MITTKESLNNRRLFDYNEPWNDNHFDQRHFTTFRPKNNHKTSYCNKVQYAGLKASRRWNSNATSKDEDQPTILTIGTISDDDSGCVIDDYYSRYSFRQKDPNSPDRSNFDSTINNSEFEYQFPPQDTDHRFCGNLNRFEKQQLIDFATNSRKAFGRATIEKVTQRLSHQKPYDQLTCAHCQGNVDMDDLCVRLSVEHCQSIWHPACFKCSTCRKRLIDLAYYNYETKIFCGRHYSELFRPRCALCDEIIFANQCVDADERTWHLHHFKCTTCKKQLGDCPYITRNGGPYCFDCFDKNFKTTTTTTTMAGCSKLTSNDLISFNDDLKRRCLSNCLNRNHQATNRIGSNCVKEQLNRSTISSQHLSRSKIDESEYESISPKPDDNWRGSNIFDDLRQSDVNGNVNGNVNDDDDDDNDRKSIESYQSLPSWPRKNVNAQIAKKSSTFLNRRSGLRPNSKYDSIFPVKHHQKCDKKICQKQKRQTKTVHFSQEINNDVRLNLKSSQTFDGTLKTNDSIDYRHEFLSTTSSSEDDDDEYDDNDDAFGDWSKICQNFDKQLSSKIDQRLPNIKRRYKTKRSICRIS